MSQRNSGHARHDSDLYETPAWVTAALLAQGFARQAHVIWEPAAGGGKMLRELRRLLSGAVHGSDISTGMDFLLARRPFGCDCIITNPPYNQATEFIKHAQMLMSEGTCIGQFAMLLRTDFDHAKSRRNLFAECPAFAKKLVLTKRIRWFEDSTGSPSFNHAWFIWDYAHVGPPTLAYGP